MRSLARTIHEAICSGGRSAFVCGVALLALPVLAGCSDDPPSSEPTALGAPSIVLVDSASAPGYVLLEWRAAHPPDSLLLQRRHDDNPWKFRAWLTPEPDGRVAFEDSTVTPGQPYTWRFHLSGWNPEYQGTVTVVVPE